MFAFIVPCSVWGFGLCFLVGCCRLWLVCTLELVCYCGCGGFAIAGLLILGLVLIWFGLMVNIMFGYVGGLVLFVLWVRLRFVACVFSFGLIVCLVVQVVFGFC